MTSIELPTSTSAMSSRVRTWLWIATLATGAYFVVHNVPRYFTWSAAAYGPYFWPRASTLLLHILCGLVAIAIGPLQFWPRIRNTYRRVHRVSGRIYLAVVLIGATSAAVLAVTSKVNFSYASGMFAFAVVWLSTSAMALVAILRRNFEQHRQWMIRSYVVTFAFVTFRVGQDVLAYFDIGRVDYVTMLSWACWALPLFFAEVAIQGRQLFARR